MTKSTPTQDKINNTSYVDDNQLFEIQKTDNDRLLTKKELADFLNVSIKMIDRKVSMNEIPFVKIGRLVRFSKKRVLAWAEESIPKR